jgi:flavin-binding protein dodecin
LRKTPAGRLGGAPHRRIRYSRAMPISGHAREGTTMAVARVTEITASSPTSFEDALQAGIARSVKTLKNVEGAWIQEQKVVVRNGKISEYRVNIKVTFVLED